jgi:hypothetical protein
MPGSPPRHGCAGRRDWSLGRNKVLDIAAKVRAVPSNPFGIEGRPNRGLGME